MNHAPTGFRCRGAPCGYPVLDVGGFCDCVQNDGCAVF
jgi:hypothetical protein